MVRPADMVVFAAVVREGSFTRGAAALGVTKQTVSERVQALEAALGVRLLERNSRTVRPTEAGAAYFERCNAIASAIDEANREIQQSQAEPQGALRISAPVLYGRKFLGPLVAQFLSRHPKVKVELSLADRRVNLLEEGFDLAIRVGDLEPSEMNARKIGEGFVYFVASPNFLRRHRVERPDDLLHVPTIAQVRHERWMVRGKQVKVTTALAVNDLEVAGEAAAASLGVARLPSLVVREAVAAGRLEVLFGPEPALVRPVYAVFPGRRLLPEKVRRFVDLIAAAKEPLLPLGPLRARSRARPADR
jgi:DNA-binding transcriptional LysR family regulator